MTATIIAFASRKARQTATRTAASLTAGAPSGVTGGAVATERANNIVPLSAWRGRARARRTPNGVFFTTGVLATFGATA